MGFSDVLRIILAVVNIIANLLGFIFGGILFAVGIVGLVFFNFFSSQARDAILYLNAGFGIFVAVGFLFLLFAVFAIVGSYLACCPKNKAMKCIAIFLLSADLAALTVILILEIVGVILAFVLRDQITENFVSVLSQGVNQSYSTAPNETQLAIISIQSAFGCCGINSAADFSGYTGYPTGEFLPPGCCNSTFESACTLAVEQGAPGCGALIGDLLVSYYNVVGGIGIFFVIMLLLLWVVELALIFTIACAKGEDGLKVV